MKYNADQIITKEMLAAPHIDHLWVFRELAHSIVSEMTEEDIRNLFQVTVIDPDGEESLANLQDPQVGSEIKNEIRQLRSEGKIRFNLCLEVYEKQLSLKEILIFAKYAKDYKSPPDVKEALKKFLENFSELIFKYRL